MESRSGRVVPVGEPDVRGPTSAEATLVEYGDLECPYTRRTRPVVRRFNREFGDRLLFAFNFPLTWIHPHGEAAEAAGAQGRYRGTGSRGGRASPRIIKRRRAMARKAYRGRRNEKA